MVPFLEGDQLASSWQVDYTGPFPLWKGQYFFFSYWNRHDASLYTMFPPKLPSVDLKNALFSITNHIPHNIASDQGTYFITKEVWQWAHVHGIYWYHSVP